MAAVRNDATTGTAMPNAASQYAGIDQANPDTPGKHAAITLSTTPMMPYVVRKHCTHEGTAPIS